MNRDEGHYLSPVYDPLWATGEPSVDESTRSRDKKTDEYQSTIYVASVNENKSLVNVNLNGK